MVTIIKIESIENGAIVIFKEYSYSSPKKHYCDNWNNAINKAISILSKQKMKE